MDGTVEEVTNSELVSLDLYGRTSCGGGMSEALAVDSLIFRLRRGDGGSRDVSLRVMAGEVLAVLGKNGMGKTTLLKTIMGFLPARRGQISIFSKPTTGQPPHHLAGRAIAYSPQEQAIFQELTVEENLKLGLPRGARLAPDSSASPRFSPFWPSATASSPARSAAGSRKC